MKVYVCVKHAPNSSANIQVRSNSIIDQTPYIVNPHDELAIFAAVELKKKNPSLELIVLTLGPDHAVETIRSALAMGMDRGIHMLGSERIGSMATAKVLARVIREEGYPLIIFTGKESVDEEGMQVMFRLAKELEMPAFTQVVDLEADFIQKKMVLSSQLECGDQEIVEVDFPVTLGMNQHVLEIVYPTLKEIIEARKKEIKTVPLIDLFDLGNLDKRKEGKKSEEFEFDLLSLTPAFEERKHQEFVGTPEEMVDQLIDILKNEKIID